MTVNLRRPVSWLPPHSGHTGLVSDDRLDPATTRPDVPVIMLCDLVSALSIAVNEAMEPSRTTIPHCGESLMFAP